MPSKSHKIFNALLYQVGWFACMIIANPIYGAIAMLVMIALHLSFVKERVKEFVFIIVAASMGYGLDIALSKMAYLDLTIKTSGTYYLLILWILFSTTLRSSMSVVLTKRKWAVLLGLSAPWAYWVGQNLGRVHYTEPFILSMSLHALLWALLMCFLYYFNDKLFGHHEKL
ncbi:DUF2878 domain-containing protein [Lentisphaera profundi]|uniref:DUF2878 domain-containing protein n=1 Tax=Lentisphaera profundi TaxID=1658616 RepID=A0ABY7W0E9_9BACT|nr:DUF2878 domain-containing protein [Lentisphaera profundi]WDE98999.1 DUF2878 domain-containing protein [Lentisphaera profundi]